MSLTEMYGKLVEAEGNLRVERENNRRLDSYLNEVRAVCVCVCACVCVCVCVDCVGCFVLH